MSILNKLFKTQEDVSESANNQARGLLIYNSVNDVIQAESVLKKSGYEYIKVVAPPPQYRTGCDLSIEFPIIEQIGIVRVLENIHLAPVDLVHVVDESMRPTEICRMKDFGEYIMVRAANMKITFNKNTHTIVNISGGGCSDVPYLASEMIGKTLADAPSPRDIGYTLCAYTLAIAFDEARKQAGIS
jgi:hypothetical protein